MKCLQAFQNIWKGNQSKKADLKLIFQTFIELETSWCLLNVLSIQQSYFMKYTLFLETGERWLLLSNASETRVGCYTRVVAIAKQLALI